MIGAKSVILNNVNIGDNAITTVCSIVNKDNSSNRVMAECPAKVVGSFDNLVSKRKNTSYVEDSKLWNNFYPERNSYE